MRSRLRDAFRKSFLERNQLAIGVVGLVLLLGAAAVALMLSGGVFTNTYSVVARFTDAAGIRPGDDVTVAGLDAGSVGAVNIKDGQVEIELKVDSDVVVPADSRAEIVIETLLGRKSVALIAGEAGRNLREGDLIPAERTSTPVEVTDLSDASVVLLERSDARALEQLMDEVTRVTRGKEREIGTLIEGLADVSSALEGRRAELSRLLESMSTLATTFGTNDDTIVSLIDRYNDVLGNLAQRRHDLRELFESTDQASHEVAALVDRNRPVLDSTLRSLHQALEVVNDHQLDLAASISYLETAVEGYSSIGYSQGIPNRWGNIFVQSVGPVGVDALAGRCGLLDQALDEILGPDPRSCEDRSDFGDEAGGGPAPLPVGADTGGSAEGNRGASNNGPADAPAAPVEDLTKALPGDIADLIDGVIGGLLGGLP
jgi:phospholipid/cholesterol/gamma-HCH transport system substrate-binding protein